MQGIVYLIGAGPGDPELITVRGVRCLTVAECVIVDDGVNPDLLLNLHPEKELIFVGKKAGSQDLSQHQIHDIIIGKAKEGKIIARLKNEDPFFFTGGREEAEALIEAGIPFEIIPGIPSVLAAPTYAGVPVTNCDFSPAVTFVAAREGLDKKGSLICWKDLAASDQTLVFPAENSNPAEIADQLISHGRSAETPVALIQGGTTPRQKVFTGTLKDVVASVRMSDFTLPSIMVVGDVVRQREKLKWFETRPLFGRRILITRPRAQAEDFRRRLVELGAEVITLPTIEIRDPDSWSPMDDVIGRIAQYQWILFTSVNGVKRFFARWKLAKKDIRDLHGIKICVIGSATGKAVISLGLNPQVVPDEYRAEGLLDSLKGKVLPGDRILIPRAKVARDVLPQTLRCWGATVNVVVAYQTVPARNNAEPLLQAFRESPVDLVAFTSSSSVTSLAELMSPTSLRELLQHVSIASIGPITSQTLRELGLKVAVQPSQFDVPSLVEAIRRHYEVSI
jgi:uroporphyrinogen III methyltransferase/synthase